MNRLRPMDLALMTAVLAATNSDREEPVIVVPAPYRPPPPPFFGTSRSPSEKFGWFRCACGAEANPNDKRWRNLSPKALMLAMGWEDRDGMMLCPKCRQLEKEGSA